MFSLISESVCWAVFQLIQPILPPVSDTHPQTEATSLLFSWSRSIWRENHNLISKAHFETGQDLFQMGELIIKLWEEADNKACLGVLSLKSIQDVYIVQIAFWAITAPFQFKSSLSISHYTPPPRCSLSKSLSLSLLLQTTSPFLLPPLFINLKGAAKLMPLG